MPTRQEIHEARLARIAAREERNKVLAARAARIAARKERNEARAARAARNEARRTNRIKNEEEEANETTDDDNANETTHTGMFYDSDEDEETSDEDVEPSDAVADGDDGEADLPNGRCASAYPEWSWDRVRTYAALRKAEAFDDDEIRALARQDIVMIEKTTGQRAFGSVEKGTIDAGRRIKAVNPECKVLFYLNAMVHYGGYEANETFRLDEWAMRTKDGKIFEWRNKFPSYDHTNLEFREWWIRRALDMAARDEVDGIFIDGIVKTDRRNLPAKGHGAAYVATAKELRRRLKGQGKILIGNALRANGRGGNAEHLEYLDGSYLEGWAHARNLEPTLELAAAAVGRGKIVMLNAGPAGLDKIEMNALRSEDEKYEYVGRPRHVGFPLGYFLLFAGPHSHLSYHVGVAITRRERALYDNSRIEALTRKLGKPLGNYEKDDKGIYSREFEHLRVEVDMNAYKGTLTVKDGGFDEL